MILIKKWYVKTGDVSQSFISTVETITKLADFILEGESLVVFIVFGLNTGLVAEATETLLAAL